MNPQSSIGIDIPARRSGDLVTDIPIYAQVRVIAASGAPNVIGYAYTEVGDGTVRVGGTGVFAGILGMPNAYVSGGDTTSIYNEDFALTDGQDGQFIRGGAVYVYSATASNIGDQLEFIQATGAIKAIAPGATVTAGSTIIAHAKVDYFYTASAGVIAVKLGDV
jgi:hypothetical protein